jgi:metal-sulfur cluster biosynthetic enzyme
MLLTKAQVYDRLQKVIDPELHVDIVALGLIYDVTVKSIQQKDGERTFIHVLMTLTTPGCPLAGVFGQMVKDQFVDVPGFDPQKDMEVELTFDPPWIPDMMSEEAKAELGF